MNDIVPELRENRLERERLARRIAELDRRFDSLLQLDAGTRKPARKTLTRDSRVAIGDQLIMEAIHEHRETQ